MTGSIFRRGRQRRQAATKIQSKFRGNKSRLKSKAEGRITRE